MEKKLILILILALISCSQKKETKISVSKEISIDTISKTQKTETSKNNRILVGNKIEGDFDGNGKNEFATVIQTKKGEGNPVEDGTPDEYAITFSDEALKSINIGCCESYLINEGDLNNDGKEDFSIFQAPMNGCTYSMTTYSLKDSNWKQIIETYLVPTGCESFSSDDLQQSIFIENKTVYILKRDPNDEELKLVKTKIDLK